MNGSATYSWAPVQVEGQSWLGWRLALLHPPGLLHPQRLRLTCFLGVPSGLAISADNLGIYSSIPLLRFRYLTPDSGSLD